MFDVGGGEGGIDSEGLANFLNLKGVSKVRARDQLSPSGETDFIGFLNI